MPVLAALVATALDKDPLSCDAFVFRGRRGDQIKVLWFSVDGINLYIKRLENGWFIWSNANDGEVLLSPAQVLDVMRSDRLASAATNLVAICFYDLTY